jgi:hypothetical protein
MFLNKQISLVDVKEVSGADVRIYLQNGNTKIGFPIQKNHNKPADMIKSCVPELLAMNASDTRIVNELSIPSFADVFNLSITKEVGDKLRALGSNWKIVPMLFGDHTGVPTLAEILASEPEVPEIYMNPLPEMNEPFVKDTGPEFYKDYEMGTLFNLVFAPKVEWDTECQGFFEIEYEFEGTLVKAKVTHCIGNWFIEGTVKEKQFRIFKTQSGVQVYVGTEKYPFNTERCDMNFRPYDKAPFIKWFKDFCSL